MVKFAHKNKEGDSMTKSEKKALLLGTNNKGIVTMMGHWNNDSGCRL